jgi:hypothetical protein
MRARLLACALALFGCGTDGPWYPTGDPADYPPIHTAFLSEGFEMGPGQATTIDFTPPRRGYVFATVDWTHGDSNVGAMFTVPSCSNVNQAFGRGCVAAEVNTSPSTCSAKPRRLGVLLWSTSPVRLWLVNPAGRAESGRVELTLCEEAPGCEAAAACAQCLTEAFGRASCN